MIQIGGIMARLGIDTVEKAQALQRVAEGQPKVKAWLRKVADLVDPAGESTADELNSG